MNRYFSEFEMMREQVNQLFSNNRTRAIDNLAKVRESIPPKFRDFRSKLYVVVDVDDGFIDNANTGRVSLQNEQMWVKDRSIAMKLFNPARTTRSMNTILVEKPLMVRDQIFDVDGFVDFMGVPQLAMLGFDETVLRQILQNKYVITSDNIRITRADYTILKSKAEKNT